MRNTYDEFSYINLSELCDKSFLITQKDTAKEQNPYFAYVNLGAGSREYYVVLAKKTDQINKLHPDFKDIYNEKDSHGMIIDQPRFYITIREDKIAEGWDIIKNILINHDVRYINVIRPEIKLSELSDPRKFKDAEDQCGLDIRISLSANPEKGIEEWSSILKMVTEALIENNISAGYKNTVGDTPTIIIPGTDYITYRYDSITHPKSDPLDQLTVEIEQSILEKYLTNSNLHPLVARPWDGFPTQIRNEEEQMIEAKALLELSILKQKLDLREKDFLEKSKTTSIAQNIKPDNEEEREEEDNNTSFTLNLNLNF